MSEEIKQKNEAGAERPELLWTTQVCRHWDDHHTTGELIPFASGGTGAVMPIYDGNSIVRDGKKIDSPEAELAFYCFYEDRDMR